MYYVYVLKSKNCTDLVYIGYSADLKARFQKHNRGKIKSTKYYKPFGLVYYEAYKNKNSAVKREFELKNNSQQKEILKDRLGLK